MIWTVMVKAQFECDYLHASLVLKLPKYFDCFCYFEIDILKTNDYWKM